MPSYDVEQLEEYLKPSRIAVVATIGRSGMPQLTPNWYVFTDGTLYISTTKERVKYPNLTRDPRMSVCIYTEPRAVDYVTLTGRVEISDDDSIWPTTKTIVERYVPPERVEERMNRIRQENRVLISLVPERVLFRTMSAQTR